MTSFPHFVDELDIPYQVVVQPPITNAVRELTSSDQPELPTPSATEVAAASNKPVPNGALYQKKFSFREFCRLQIGKRWYRVSDNVEWFMRLRARWQTGSPNGTWVDDGSDYDPK